jgi:hypothetical protein
MICASNYLKNNKAWKRLVFNVKQRLKPYKKNQNGHSMTILTKRV